MTNDDLMTARQVAEWLQLKPERLWLWRKKSQFPQVHRVPYDDWHVFYSKAEVEAWLKAQKVTPSG